jgi:acyl-coenzyme A synthetase/AMP-(fatty) acid ligase
MQLVSKAIQWYAEHCVDTIALASSSGEITYGELNDHSNTWARHLEECGVSVVDRVLILMDNDIEFVEAMIALVRIGTSIVFMNTGLSVVEIGRICKEAQIGAVITERKYERLEQYIWSELGESPIFFYKEAVSENLRDATNSLHGNDRPIQIPQEASSELIFFTSGSTGKPKGILIDKCKFDLELSSYPTTAPATYCIARPLFFRAHFSSLCFMLQEGKTILLTTLSDPANVYELLESYHARQIISSPFDLFTLFKWMQKANKELPKSMKELVSTGSSLSPRIRDEIRIMAPSLQLTDMYGLSEIGAIAMIDNRQWERNKGSIGKPIFFVKIRIVDEHGEEQATGVSGEICVSSRFMMDRYYNDELLNQQTFCNGYIRTGDIGYVDGAGYLYMVGRKDQSINRAGYMFHLSEIENLLYSHPQVEQAAVIRSIDEYGLQVPVAFIQPLQLAGLSSEVLIEGLKNYCLEHLSSFKIPERFVIVEQMPLNEAGKINMMHLQEVM